VVKVLAPFIASQPAVPLPLSRALHEVRGCKAAGRVGAIAAAGVTVQAADVLGWRAAEWIDAGPFVVVVSRRVGTASAPAVDLQCWVETRAGSTQAARDMGLAIGTWLTRLHASTFNAPSRGVTVPRNDDVVASRAALQYGGMRDVAASLIGSGLTSDDVDAVASGAAAVAAAIASHPGMCLTMGDLWPRSLLVESAGKLGGSPSGRSAIHMPCNPPPCPLPPARWLRTRDSDRLGTERRRGTRV
jgi:hypothetical protein